MDKVKAQDAQRARTEARLVQLKLTVGEQDNRARELDNPLDDETDLSLSFLCVFFPYDLFPSLTFRLIRVLCLCVTLSYHPGLKRERDDTEGKTCRT